MLQDNTKPSMLAITHGLAKEDNIESSSYFPVYHGKATDQLAGMTTRDAKPNPITRAYTIDNGELKVVMREVEELGLTLGVNTHKLLSAGLREFTRLNNYSQKTGDKRGPLKYEVAIPLKDYAAALGYETMPRDNTEREQKRASEALKTARKRISKDMDALGAITLSWKEKVKGKTGDFIDLKIIGSRGIKDGYIYLVFDPKFAEYAASLPITQYPISLLSMDPRKSNAYIIGLKLSEHANIDNNIKRGTAERLKVRTLLNYAQLITIKEARKTRQSWLLKIKEPLEQALEELVASGTLTTWQYTGAEGRELTDAEATPAKYEEWIELYVTYCIAEAPDHSERIARRDKERKARTRRKKA